MTISVLAVPRAIIAWFRAGYPKGVPGQDYVAIFGVLHRRLTPVEVAIIAETVGPCDGSAESTRDEIAAEISRVAKEKPGPADIELVTEYLAATNRQIDDPGEPSTITPS